MTKIIDVLGLFVCFVACSAGMLVAQESGKQQDGEQKESQTRESEEEPQTIEVKTVDWEAVDGFQPWYWDEADGKVWLKISDWDREFLFAWGLATGLGSNPVGLDRGQLGSQFVCQFKRVGKKVFLVARNLDYRASSDNPVERRSVRESFAESILWGGEVAAETGTDVLVDMTALLTSDLHGVIGKLKRGEQGDYSLDQTRCGVYLNRCKSFPKNTELEATLTFSGQDPGNHVSQVTPSPKNITLRQHVSFVELPDDGYQPRAHHPRSASMFIQFSDYAAPIDEPLRKRWIIRHRLIKENPEAELSPPLEPIVYYVDPGAPELVRDALIEGASWWNDAFVAAGFENAFQVRVLPDDADPMDVRYNVIQWVHRSTRGWSYGGSVIDPRTGEIIKGHVTLGSLRVRQDRLMFDAMAPVNANLPQTRADRNAACCGIAGITEDTTLAGLTRRVDPVDVALARIRQLSAHEVGHTLGLVHNFAASTYGDRASVMDYPAPRVKIVDGDLDLSDAYGTGIGIWDKWSIEYAYRQYADGADESVELDRLVKQAIEQNLAFVSDSDARPAGAAHPYGSLWDNGTNPVEELKHVMKVRRIALRSIGPKNLQSSEPLSNLEQVFVPVYLHHRFQVDATAKLIGGVEYSYDVAAYDSPMKVVPETMQIQAFEALLDTLDPGELTVRDELWRYLVPQAFSTHRDIETFAGKTAPVFDRQSAARVAADMTIGNLLQPQRFSRLAMLPPSDSFGVRKYMVQLIDKIWRQPLSSGQTASVSQVVKQSLTDHLLALTANSDASVAARAAARFGIVRVKQYLESTVRTSTNEQRQFAALMQEQIKRFESRPYPSVNLPSALPAPPGSPIGSGLR